MLAILGGFAALEMKKLDNHRIETLEVFRCGK